MILSWKTDDLILSQKGVDTVLAEKYNTEARKLFGVEDDASIQIFAVVTGSVRKVVERLN